MSSYYDRVICKAVGVISGQETEDNCLLAAEHGIDPMDVVTDATRETVYKAGDAITSATVGASTRLTYAIGIAVVGASLLAVWRVTR